MPSHVPANPTPEQRRTLLLGVLLTVFIDLLSFGMFIPDLQIRGEKLAADYLRVPIATAGQDVNVGIFLGLLIAGFSVAQLLSAPGLGRVSDRIGRRPVLLISITLSICSYLLYAHSDTFWLTLISRILAGIAAANLGVCFAYVADITPPEERAKGIGLIGAGLGLGFILGPGAGVLILNLGNNNPLWLGYVAAGLCLINFLYVWLKLPESLRPDSQVERESFLTELKIAFATPGMPLLLAMFFAFNFSFALLQSTFFRLLYDQRSIFHLEELDAKNKGAIILSLVGVFGALMQGGILPRVLPKFGEIKLLRIGLILLVPGLFFVPYAPLWGGIIFVVACQGIGSGLTQPTISALVSKSAPARIQGGIFGVTQALGALARLVGPLFASPLFARNVASPYWLASLAILFPLFAAWTLRPPAAQAVSA